METEIIIIAIAVTLLISWAIAEFFGRAKHIGFGWTFALTATTAFIGGIIALLVSPSAKDEPTKGGQGHVMGAAVCFVFGALNIVMLNPLALGFFVLGAYFLKLSKGGVINDNPKYVLKNLGIQPVSGKTSPVEASENKENNKKKKATTFQEIREQLIFLKEKGLLSEMEYFEKLAIIKDSHIQSKIEKTKEYKQLKNLQEEGILTSAEFDSKIGLIKVNLLERTESEEALMGEIHSDYEGDYKDLEDLSSYTIIQESNKNQFKREPMSSKVADYFIFVICVVLLTLFFWLAWQEYK